MSRTNKHRTNQHQSISLVYMQEVLGKRQPCPKRSCKGTCTNVVVQYEDHGPLNHEQECTTCGKVIKDPKFKKDRQKYWDKRKKKYKKKSNSNEKGKK